MDEEDGLLNLLLRGGRGALGLLDRGMRAVTAENIAGIPGLLDRGMRAMTPEVGARTAFEFSPAGDLKAGAEIPGLLSEGRLGAAAVNAASMLPVVGVLGDVARTARPVNRELRALQNRFTEPIREALAAGNPAEATRLSREMVAARPGGFTSGMLSESGPRNRPVFHGTTGPAPTQSGFGIHVAEEAETANRRIIDLQKDFTRPSSNARIIPLEIPDERRFLNIGRESAIVKNWSPQGVLDVAAREGAITAQEAKTALRGIEGATAQGERVSALLNEKGFDGLRYINLGENAGSTSYFVTNTQGLTGLGGGAAAGPSGLLNQ